MSDKDLREQFIRYFDDDKYKFENFCKIFLKWLDFDDIQVTQRRGDGGIDLKCNKKEIEQLNLNIIEYVVQAKCYGIKNKVSPSDIRDFRGSKTDMSVRKIFITTSDYTKGAIEEADDTNQPITLINGQQLIDFCKSYSDTMFDIKYYFNKQKLDDLFKEDESDNIKIDVRTIERRITKNDVRARILRIPSEYKNLIKDKNSFKLSINGTECREYNISSDKSYFGGVTKFYKDFISNVDFKEAQSIWNYDDKNEIFNIIIK
jgi:restriction system protein